MAQNKTGKKVKRSSGMSDTQKWVSAILLFVVSLFLIVAVISYYFYWQDDQSFVSWGSITGDSSEIVYNPAGKLGAVAASYIVGKWFGVFGIMIPVMVFLLGLKIINPKPIPLGRWVAVTMVITILGSLSLGYLFGTRWSFFGTGLGGAHGIFISEWMRSLLGVAGTGLILLLGWILLAVYINRRSIKLFNKVGKGIYEGGVKVGHAVAAHTTELIKKDEQEEMPQELIPDPEDTLPDITVTEQLEVAPWDMEPAEDITGPPEVIVEQPVMEVSQPDPVDTFEIRDSRKNSVESDISDSFEVVDKIPAAATVAADISRNVFTLGEQTDVLVRDKRELTVEEPQKIYAATIGEQSATSQPTVSSTGTDEPVDPAAGELEVVGGSGTVLKAGGILESTSPDSVTAQGGLEVLVAGRQDALVDTDQIEDRLYDPTKELSKFRMPPVELLEDHSIDVQVTEDEIYENKNNIVRTLENFGIKIDKIKATIGPTVTLYEIVPAAGVKISKIKNLEDDIALSLKALGIRIIAPMPGKGTIGIEVPNKDKEIVSMYSVIKTRRFQESGYELPVVLGKTISNETFVIDLAKMPHLLVAGATGQGKSVGLNAIITSLLYRKHPAELKFVLVDPKRVELSLYAKLEKHYLAKMESEEDAILTDTQRVVYTLNSLCNEMSDRYDLLRKAEVKKISEYNEKFRNRKLNPNNGHRFLPYIVVIIDEFADMIMTAGREVEAPITRLAQLARAVGIHLVIATQRPDVKVITGLIKANFPARIAFRVMSMIDSRTIIDQPGANQLIGRGDMLMSLNGELTRVQCAFIDTPEIERVTEFISNQRGYGDAYGLPDYTPETEGAGERSADLGPLDAMFEDVARFVVQNQQGSTSSIQRRFSIGYNRAGRIMDQLEDSGIVGRAEGSKPREVLISDMNSLEYILKNIN